MGAVSLTLDEARTRAALVSDVSYDLHLDLTDRDTFGVRATVRFACSEPGASTFLELLNGQEVLLDGLPATTYDGRRLALHDLSAAQRGDGGGAPSLRHRRRRDAHVHRSRGRPHLRLGVRRDGPRAADLPVLRPERPQGAGDARGDRPRPVAGPGERTRDQRRRRRHLDVRHHAADPAADVHGLRRAVALRHLGARRASVRLARPRLAGRPARPRRRGAAAGHRGVLRPLRAAVRRAVRVRLLRPGLRPRAQLGCAREPRLRHLPRRDPARRHTRRRASAGAARWSSPTRWPTCGSATSRP